MTKDIPASNIQTQAFLSFTHILNQKIQRAILGSKFYQKLGADLNKNRNQNQVFPCSQCSRVFDIIHKRSAHMNKHIKQAKRLQEANLQQQKQMPQKRKYIKKERKLQNKEESKVFQNIQNQKQLVDAIFEGQI